MVQTQIHQDRQWKYSDVVVPETEPLDVGKHTCLITKTAYDEQKDVVSYTLTDIYNGQESKFDYWMQKKDYTPNDYSIRVLTGLKRALRGPDAKGNLWHEDALHGLVNVKITIETWEGKDRLKCNSYEPVTQDIYDLVAESGNTVQAGQYIKPADGEGGQ